MKKLINLLIVCCLHFMLSSCGNDSVFPESQTQLVVEGILEDGQSPFVYLTTTIQLDTTYLSLDSVFNHIIRHATVKVTTKDESVFLTGKTRRKEYTFPFEYTTGRITCHEGESYHLSIDYEDLHVESTATVPVSIKLDTIYTQYVNDSLFKIIAVPSPEANGYLSKFFIKTTNTGGDYQYAPQLRTSEGNYEIFKPLQLGESSSENYFKKGEDVYIRYSILTDEGYRFWTSYDELLTLSRNFLIPVTENLSSNIEGGIGCWFGYGSTYYRFINP